MSLRTLRLKISKSMKIDFGKIVLWLKMEDGTLAELDSAHDAHDLAWLGLEDGSDILIHMQDK
jgi:hypothetical protein